MARFMLLLHQSPDRMQPLAPEEIQRIVADYAVWRDDLVRKHLLLGGEKLADEGGRRLRRVDGRTVATDGPFSELAEVVGGYFTVEADDYAAAERLAATCPHLAGDRWIEIRRIDDVH